MLLSEIDVATRDNHLVHQLFSLKRCFGAHSSIGVVVGPGVETDRCSTVAELVQAGHVSSGLEWLDPFLLSVPSVLKIPCSIYVDIVPPKYNDGGPPCPWDVARQQQEEARSRVLHRRLARRASLPCICLRPANLENEMPYVYETEKPELFTDGGQRRFLGIRDKIAVLLETSGAFRMDSVLSGGDWECMACVDRLVELDEIREIPQFPPGETMAQHRIFVKVGC